MEMWQWYNEKESIDNAIIAAIKELHDDIEQLKAAVITDYTQR